MAGNPMAGVDDIAAMRAGMEVAPSPSAGRIMYTTPDPLDGHIHEIDMGLIDDSGTGATEVSIGEGSPQHLHAIVAGVIQPATYQGYRSEHDDMVNAPTA